MDRLWLEGADGRRRFLDRMVLSFEPAHAEAVLAYEKAMRERNRLLKDQIRDPGWYQAIEALMAEAGAQVAHHRRVAVARLMQAQAGAGTAFSAADLAIPHADSGGGEGGEALGRAFFGGGGREKAEGGPPGGSPSGGGSGRARRGVGG